MDLLDIFRTFHPNAEYAFFSNAYSPGKTTSWVYALLSNHHKVDGVGRRAGQAPCSPGI